LSWLPHLTAKEPGVEKQGEKKYNIEAVFTYPIKYVWRAVK